MNSINVKAHAKINLSLNVLGKLPNGYHDLRTVMQTLRLHDDISIKKTDNAGVTIKTNHRWLPLDARNLSYRAAEWFLTRINAEQGVHIDIFKRIPVAAGMAGGSSDCAATLRAMRALFKAPVSDVELFKTAASMSADAPFCLVSGTALAEGIGDKITPLRSLPPIITLIAKPNARVATADVFGKFDEACDVRKIAGRAFDIGDMLSAIALRDARRVAANLRNDLETVTIAMYPIINDIKRIMLESGAMGSVMSGSGSAVFGIFSKKRDAIAASNAIEAKLPEVRDIFLTFAFTPRHRIKNAARACLASEPDD
jgi:4-diphosphocytidyl-2-C-methyl-D-erythritol kinase